MVLLSQRVFRLFAMALGLPEVAFDNYTGTNGDDESTWGSTLRLVHYPPIERSANTDQIGYGAHTDFGTC